MTHRLATHRMAMAALLLAALAPFSQAQAQIKLK
jgi:hypothetical protein